MDAVTHKGLGLWGGRLIEFETLPSTNTWALEHAAELRHGDVVWARAQTAGRGRLERSWLALAGRSLTVTVVLQDPVFRPLGPNLGQVAACALTETLAGFGLRGLLKWPNDVMVQDAKIAGLLVELAETPPVFVLGIGLNVNGDASFFRSAGLDRPATSMEAAAGRSFAVAEVLKRLLASLQAWLVRVGAEGLAPVRMTWADIDWLAGCDIEAHTAAGVVAGRYAGMDELGRLVVAGPQGETALWSGDVERVRRAVDPAGVPG
jgi:BirA family biotin operon repressor/biotin-[acetyl-CoA-carboxylase] ligase